MSCTSSYMCRCEAILVGVAHRCLGPELMEQPQACQVSTASSMMRRNLLPCIAFQQHLSTMELMELPQLLDISSLQSMLPQLPNILLQGQQSKKKHLPDLQVRTNSMPGSKAPLPPTLRQAWLLQAQALQPHQLLLLLLLRSLMGLRLGIRLQLLPF